MKRIFLSIISIILIFAFTSCSVETADEYESRIESEAESIKDIQEMLTEEATTEETETTQEDVTTTTNSTTKETSTKEATTKASTTEETTVQYITVYLTVECDAVLGIETGIDLPANGIWLYQSPIIVPEGSNVYDVLVYAQSSGKLTFTEDSKSVPSSRYIFSINNLSASVNPYKGGWMYSYNNVVYMKPCNAQAVINNDIIKWYYVLY